MYLHLSLDAQSSSGPSTGPFGHWSPRQCHISDSLSPGKKRVPLYGGLPLPEAHVTPLWPILDLRKV